LSEPPGEKEEKANLLARWPEGGGERSEVGPRGRSKDERIDLKMGLVPIWDRRKIKSEPCKARKCGEWEDTLASQKYTPVSSRARGTY
jgi:hypothetical protein